MWHAACALPLLMARMLGRLQAASLLCSAEQAVVALVGWAATLRRLSTVHRCSGLCARWGAECVGHALRRSVSSVVERPCRANCPRLLLRCARSGS